MELRGLGHKEPKERPHCVQACPAGIDIPRYIRFIGEGKFDEALSVIREKIPFPSICGYACPHPCEEACQANRKLSKPLAIRSLKRFVAERGYKSFRERANAPSTGKRVAVVGSGPAGLTAAYYLRKLGHGVHVYESLPKPGGMMRFGIPRFVLSSDVLDREIEAILSVGIELKLNTVLSKLTDLKKEGDDAILLANGLQAGKELFLPGAHLDGVLVGLAFLREVNMGQPVKIGQRVAVIGGGNVAIDAARTALRLGAQEVTVLYRRSREEMPAYQKDVEDAEKEGVRFRFFTSPVEMIQKSQGSLSIHCIKTEPSQRGKRLIQIQGSDHSLEFNTVISAIGQTSDLSFLEGTGVQTTPDGTIQADPVTLQTSEKGVFSGGDIVTGARTIIDAIAAGRRAASSIDQYLGGSGELDERIVLEERVHPALQGFPVGNRNEGASLPADERIKGFALVEIGFAKEEEAITEAKRCLRCDLPITVDCNKCTGCFTCSLQCSFVNQGIFNPMKAHVKVAPSVEGENTFSFSDDCDDCGICARYCPYGALAR